MHAAKMRVPNTQCKAYTAFAMKFEFFHEDCGQTALAKV